MVTLTSLIQNVSYYKIEKFRFYDLLAYFLQADCACLSLAWLKTNVIIVRSNSNGQKTLDDVNENISKVIDFIVEQIQSLNEEKDINAIKEIFFDLVIKYKFQQEFKNPQFILELRKKKFWRKHEKEKYTDLMIAECKEKFVNNRKSSHTAYKYLLDHIVLRWELFLNILDFCRKKFTNETNIRGAFLVDKNYIWDMNQTLNNQLIHSELLVSECVYSKYYLMYSNYDDFFDHEEHNQQTPFYYVGSNLKNCPCCGIYIKIINEMRDIAVKTCGIHLKFYSSWDPWDLTDSIETLRLLNAFYNKINNSDDESEFTLSDNSSIVNFTVDEQIRDLLKKVNQVILNKIVESNNMKFLLEDSIDWNNVYQLYIAIIAVRNVA